jgi:hypothetical protein
MLDEHTDINRVSKIAKEALPQIQAKTQQERIQMASILAFSDADYAEYQNTQSRAFAMQKISEDEAMLTYNTLMDWHSKPKAHSSEVLATRFAVQTLLGHLLSLRLAKKL